MSFLQLLKYKRKMRTFKYFLTFLTLIISTITIYSLYSIELQVKHVVKPLKSYLYRLFNESLVPNLYYSSHTGTVNEINFAFKRHNVSIRTAQGKLFSIINLNLKINEFM